MSRPSFRDRVLSASTWGLGSSVVRYSFEMSLNVALARLLTPSDFGLLAAATPISGMMAALGNVGFGAALVQRKEIREAHYAAVFWLAWLSAAVLGGLTAASGPLVAQFYEREELAVIMPVLALQFPLAALMSVPSAQLRRELRFPLVSKLELVGMLLSGATAIALAVGGGGVFALVVRPLLVQAVMVVGSMWAVRWRPRGFIEIRALREILSFSASYYGAQLFRYASRNADNVAIGKVYGAVELGYYSRAYSLMTLPIAGGAKVVLDILFAAFSNIQGDHKRIRNLYLKFSGVLALAIVPFMVGAAVVAESFIVAVLGPQWAPMAEVFSILAVSGIWQSVNAIHDALYLSQGRSDLRLRYSVFGRVLVLIGIAAGLPFGIVGVAIGFSLGSAVDNILSVDAASKLVGLRWWRILHHLRWVILTGACMGLLVWAVSTLTPVKDMGHWTRIAILIPIGVIAYLGPILVFRPQPYRDVVDVVRQRLSRRKESDAN